MVTDLFCLFLHCREETERVGELQTSNDNTALPDDVLASGSEGVKETIHGFSDAYVIIVYMYW
jgi:serine/threonine-protein phosphatase 2B catalytic subunit